MASKLVSSSFHYSKLLGTKLTWIYYKIFHLRFWLPCAWLPSSPLFRPVPDSWPSPLRTSNSSADPLHTPLNTPLNIAPSAVLPVNQSVLVIFSSIKLNCFLFPTLGDVEPEAAASSRARSGSYDGNDYVAYGAYTGGYGAFGWYTDHPVMKKE